MARRLRDVFVVVLWFAANIGVVFLNKLLLSNYKFRYPIFLTGCHMLSASLFSVLYSAFFQSGPKERLKSRTQVGKVALLSAIFCLSVATGNVSLRFIPVSLNQAIGATTPVFTALLGLLVLRKRETTLTYLSLVPVVAGTTLASGFEPSVNVYGVLMCLLASAARALKSVLQELLLTDGESLSSMALLGYMAPMALALLIPGSLIVEGNVLGTLAEAGFLRPRFLGLLGLNCCAAYVANLANFLVTKATSALTLQVLGKAKGVIAVALSLILFRNRVKPGGMLGYGVCLIGVFTYSYAKYTTLTAGGKGAAGGALQRGMPPSQRRVSEPAKALNPLGLDAAVGAHAGAGLGAAAAGGAVVVSLYGGGAAGDAPAALLMPSGMPSPSAVRRHHHIGFADDAGPSSAAAQLDGGSKGGGGEFRGGPGVGSAWRGGFAGPAAGAAGGAAGLGGPGPGGGAAAARGGGTLAGAAGEGGGGGGGLLAVAVGAAPWLSSSPVAKKKP